MYGILIVIMKIVLVVIGVCWPLGLVFLLAAMLSFIEYYKENKLNWKFDNLERERYGLDPISFKEWKFWQKLRRMGLKH